MTILGYLSDRILTKDETTEETIEDGDQIKLQKYQNFRTNS